jgi:putative transposase
VELLLAERGVTVSHESIRHLCRKFGAEFARNLRQRRPKPGDTWHFDEVFLRIGGRLHYLWRAVDQHGVVLDILQPVCEVMGRAVACGWDGRGGGASGESQPG